MTTPRSTSRATSVLAPSAQSGPPTSVEPTVRPGLARQVAVKRGSDAATRLRSNPETGCQSDEHYRSLIGNGCPTMSRLVDLRRARHDGRRGVGRWRRGGVDANRVDLRVRRAGRAGAVAAGGDLVGEELADLGVARPARPVCPARAVQARAAEVIRPAEDVQARRRGRGRRRADSRVRPRSWRPRPRARTIGDLAWSGCAERRQCASSGGNGQRRRARACTRIRRPERSAIRVVP